MFTSQQHAFTFPLFPNKPNHPAIPDCNTTNVCLSFLPIVVRGFIQNNGLHVPFYNARVLQQEMRLSALFDKLSAMCLCQQLT
jgi:hypothetical protein